MPFVSEVFYFLIKKELMFSQMVVHLLPRRWGRSYLQIGKAIYSLKKKKLKNGYVQIEKKLKGYVQF